LLTAVNYRCLLTAVNSYYLLSIVNKLYISLANIHWSKDEQTIYYKGKGIGLGKIKSMCYILIEELQEAIQELTFSKDVPSIDLGAIVDSIA
jgi:hypothetical protein